MIKKLIHSALAIFVILVIALSVIRLNYYHCQAQAFFAAIEHTLAPLNDGETGTFSFSLPHGNKLLFFIPYWHVELSNLETTEDESDKINRFFNCQDSEFGLMWLNADNDILAVKYALDILPDLEPGKAASFMHWQGNHDGQITVCIKKSGDLFRFAEDYVNNNSEYQE